MYAEDELLPISALQHLLYCERQCALIHLEGVWLENRFTAEGRVLHERVDEGGRETRGEVRTARSLMLACRRLGLVGRADVVELHREPGGARLPGLEGRWRPFPIEYKRGRPKSEPWDEVQLCAQALCLEEMLGIEVPSGALFYGERRRRTAVAFDLRLRERTEAAALRLHELIRQARTPPAVYGPRCRACSLRSACQPKAAGRPVSGYLNEMLASAGEAG